MTKVNIKYIDNDIKEIIVSGHAGFAKAGEDIVCAAISTLVTTTINNILALEEEIEVAASDAELKIIVNNITAVNQSLLTCMKIMLTDLMIDYPKHLKIKEE